MEKIEITSDGPSDEAMDAHIEACGESLQTSQGKVLAQLGVPLEASLASLYKEETNCGNWVADLLRDGCQADVALVPGSALHADCCFREGPFTLGDLNKLVPFLDELAVVALKGSAVLRILEHSVSAWPEPAALFGHVAGLRFSFDGSLPVGGRIVPGSVVMASTGQPLEEDAEYRVASLESVTKGQEGYEAFGEGRVVCGGAMLSSLPVLLRNHLSMINTASSLQATKFAHWRQGSVNFALQSGKVVSDKKDSLNNENANAPQWEGVKVAPAKDGRVCQIGA